MDTVRGRLDFAGREKLVDEGLCGIARSGGKSLFVCLGGDGVGVLGEQVSQVKCEGSGLVDGDRTVCMLIFTEE